MSDLTNTIPSVRDGDLAKALRDAYGRGAHHIAQCASIEPDPDERFQENRDAWIRQYMARMPAAAPVSSSGDWDGWLPMKDAPTGVPIIAKHKPNAQMPHGWVATIKLGHGDDEEAGCYDTILHYNGEESFRGFRGTWTGWLPMGSAIPAGSDGGELERLSRAATPGPWNCRLLFEVTPEDSEYCDALVNAHRSGRLVLASGSGEEKGGAETLQARNAAWMRIAFADDPTDLPERIARFGEEALELQQALGQSCEDAHALVDYVYSRPAGAPATEFGQTAGSLACLAEFAGYDLEAAAEVELDRVSTPEFLAKLRAKRATRHGRGPLPGFSAPGTSETPEPYPQSSPTLKTGAMTVEEAKEVLRLVGAVQPPKQHIRRLRDVASKINGTRARALLARADRIETALRTLQDRGEVRHG